MTADLAALDAWIEAHPPAAPHSEAIELRMLQIAESWDDETGQHRPLRARWVA